jgi:hypothetical protein
MRAFVQDAAARSAGRLRPLRNRAFRTVLRVDPDAPVAVLSPHLDDAVLDCWSVLTGPGRVQVVNVFAGMPRAGEVGYFERLAGAADSATHMRRRIAEDREALARAGRSAINLGFRSFTHRRARPEPAFAVVDAALCAHLPAVSGVYGPAALGVAHPDHALVRAYALALAAQGMPVRLYADVPYCTTYGWPAWVTGAEPDPHLDVDVHWSGSVGGAQCSRGRAEVVRLPGPDAHAKLAAMRVYEAEFAVLDRGPIGQLSNPAIHGFEVFWPAPDGRP